jgi:HNH endonuclease
MEPQAREKDPSRGRPRGRPFGAVSLFLFRSGPQARDGVRCYRAGLGAVRQRRRKVAQLKCQDYLVYGVQESFSGGIEGRILDFCPPARKDFDEPGRFGLRRRMSRGRCLYPPAFRQTLLVGAQRLRALLDKAPDSVPAVAILTRPREPLAIAAQPWCWECGDAGSPDNPLTADHVIPVSRGGDPLGALSILCWRCNSRKGARLYRLTRSAIEVHDVDASTDE